MLEEQELKSHEEFRAFEELEIGEWPHPALGLIFEAFRISKEQNAATGLTAAIAGFVANSLYIYAGFFTGRFEKLPVSAKDSSAVSIGILKEEIVDLKRDKRCTTKATQEVLETVPESLEELVTKPAQFAKLIYRGAQSGTQARVLVSPEIKGIYSLRSNRNPKAALQKVFHWIIFAFLFPFGALTKTESNLSSRGPFSPEELKAIFDYCCPVCEGHSSEALRKSASRFMECILKRWPTSGIKGNRASSCRVRIKVSGLC